jgi:hypothetical protein
MLFRGEPVGQFGQRDELSGLEQRGRAGLQIFSRAVGRSAMVNRCAISCFSTIGKSAPV